MIHRRRITALTVALVAVVGLGACTSNPSAKAVAQDVVESLDLEPAQEACMLRVIDTYSEEQLDAIGTANETVDFGTGVPADRGDEALQRFYADLDECMSEG